MENIQILHNNLKISFNVDEQKKIRISYFGNEECNFLTAEKIEFNNFVQILASSTDHQGCHCDKLVQTPYSKTYKYVSHSIRDNEKGSILSIVTENDMFEVETVCQFYKNSNSFSVYNNVKNIINNPVRLEFVSSFFLEGFGNDNSPICNDMFIHKATNSWHCEAQWTRNSFLHEGIFNGNDCHSMKSYSINNTGSWSTKDYLPMCIIERESKKQFLLMQVENNGSWHIEIGDFANNYYVSASGPEYHDNQWTKVLKPGETFKSVQVSVSLGDSFENVIQEITKARRLMRRPSIDDEEQPIIFNDYMHALWDTQNEALIWPLVDIAAEAGCEEFCIDAGWFALGCGWTNEIGVWEEYKDNFPTGGFKGTFDYIRSKGMKTGLWFEIENVGMDSPLAKSLPKDWFFQVNGELAQRNYRYALNFANPEVYKYAMDIVCKRIDEYGLDYIKNDYNVDAGPGNECGSDSVGDGLLEHNRAFIRWLNELMDKYPNLTIENCGSGGCRMDYEMLKVCPIQSTSDQTDYRKYPYLASAVLTAATPEQAAVWSYPVNKQINEPVTDEVVAMNMVNAMLGRIHLSSYINELTPFQFNLVKEGLQCYKDIRDFKKTSLPIYPNGISYFFDKEVVGGLINDDMMILNVWNTSGAPRTVRVDLSKYGIKNLKVKYPLSLKTNYSFDEETKLLIVTFDSNYGGRTFQAEVIK